LRIIRTKFEAIESAFASQRIAAISRATARFSFGVRLADDSSKERIGAKLIVVIEVFITKYQAVDALSDEVFKRMFDQRRVTEIFEASSELRDDVTARFELTQKDSSAVRGDSTAVEVSHNIAASNSLKVQRSVPTLCNQSDSSSLLCKMLQQRYFYHEEGLLP
jgi:hypothetical protein